MQQSTVERINSISEKLDCCELTDVGNLIRHLHSAREESVKRRLRHQTKQSSGTAARMDAATAFASAAAGAAELAVEQCQGLASQMTKKILF